MRPGTRTLGRYKVLREVGRGGMAVVYLAHDAELERRVALKELYALGAADDSLVQRFVREARVAGSLSHPNIVTVHDFFEHEGIPYIAMEYVPGGSLRPSVGALSLPQIAGVLEGALAGLAHAERRGVVHRDLKPENLLVTDEGRIEIADFGIAKAIDQTTLGGSLTATGMTVGTPYYMAPEQAMSRRIGPWTDLYSLGVVAYELLTGTVPFSDRDTPLAILLRHIQDPVPDPLALRPDLDPELVAWMLVLLAKPPERRPPGASAAWESLEPIVLRLAGPLWRRDAALPAADCGTEDATTVSPAPFTTPAESAYETYQTPPPREPEEAPAVAPATTTSPAETVPSFEAPTRRSRRSVAWPAAGIAVFAAAVTAVALVSLPGKREPTARPPATVARATATAARTAATATPTASTPAATATPTATATPAAPSKGRAIALRDEPRDVIVYRDAVWVTTPGTHAVRRVNPSTRAVRTIKLEPDADPRQMEAGLGALWVDSWTNAFTRIDAMTGDWTTIYMPTKSKSGYGFAVGDGAARALDRQHGILYTLDAATGQPDGDGLQLGGPAIDAVATGGIVYVLLKPQLLGKVDARTGTFYDSVRLPARPVGIERERSKLVVAFAGDRFATYDAGTLRHTKLFSMGREWERGETSRSELWVTVPTADAIDRFDTRTGDQLGEPIAFDSTPVALNFEPSGRAWVGLQSGALLSVDVPRA